MHFAILDKTKRRIQMVKRFLKSLTPHSVDQTELERETGEKSVSRVRHSFSRDTVQNSDTIEPLNMEKIRIPMII